VTAELFPVFLKLEGRRVLLVGGGPVAAAKLPALVRAGADVHVVAPRVSAGIRRHTVTVAERAFRPSDLNDAWLVIAAATPAVNERVARAAGRQRLFVNAVDDPQRASAYLGAVVRRDGLTLAISTEGAAPALAALLRESLDSLLAPVI
jgi:siroheme synthase-like protein